MGAKKVILCSVCWCCSFSFATWYEAGNTSPEMIVKAVNNPTVLCYSTYLKEEIKASKKVNKRVINSQKLATCWIVTPSYLLCILTCDKKTTILRSTKNPAKSLQQLQQRLPYLPTDGNIKCGPHVITAATIADLSHSIDFHLSSQKKHRGIKFYKQWLYSIKFLNVPEWTTSWHRK